jgi:hypothetical protein
LKPTWGSFVAAVAVERPPLGAVLEHARVLSFEPERIELGFEANEFYARYLVEGGTLAFLESCAGACFGRKRVPCSVTTLTAATVAPPSLVEERARQEEAHRTALHEEAVNDPRVRRVVEILGGSVREVRPLRTSN